MLVYGSDKMKYPVYLEKDANSDYGVTVPDILVYIPIQRLMI